MSAKRLTVFAVIGNKLFLKFADLYIDISLLPIAELARG